MQVDPEKCNAYVICTSPRSGSTLLCKLLAATGVAGKPESYFHKPSISDWLSALDLVSPSTSTEREVLDTIFKAAIDRGTLDTGIFGLRLQCHSFDFFFEQLARLHPALPSDKLRLHEAFGRTMFIHLTRGDKIEQAVSNVKAEQTGLWHMSADGTELERVSPAQTLTYDPDRIRALVMEMEAYDSQWEKWFTAEKIAPLRITYESLSAHPIKALREVLGHLGLDCEVARNVKPEVAKLADETNQDWVDRFRLANVIH